MPACHGYTNTWKLDFFAVTMCPRIFTFKNLFFCFYTIHQVYSRLATSSPTFQAFFTLEDRIVSGLGRYVRHEIDRLDIIRNASGYEDEVPIVEKRIKLLKEFHEEAQKNASSITDDIRLVRAHHPTSSFIAVKNFVLNWRPLLRNQTLYGFRLQEFLNVSSGEIPGVEDFINLHDDIVYISLFYNLSVSDVFNGDVLGEKGDKLTIMDAYDIGKHALSSKKLRLATEWFELVINESKKINNKTDVNIPLVLSELALLYYQFGDDEKALSFVREAYALNETDNVIYKRFMRIENDNVAEMADFDTLAPAYWKNFTELCQANATFRKPMQWYHRCRLRCSPNPLRRYKEEILSIAPYLSVFYDIIDDDVIEDMKNKTKTQLKKSDNVYYKDLHGKEIEDFPESGRLLSHLASEISGLNASYTPGIVSSGSPLRVFKFGFGGRANPYNHLSMSTRVMMGAGKKIAAVTYYLSEVEKGGATVFLDIGIRYQPRKGSALLWFNTKPSGEDEMRLTKAECVHALGEKWMVEKDIYSHKNTFARPCARKLLGNQIGLDRAVHKFRHCGF